MQWILGLILLWFCTWLFSLFIGWTWAIVLMLALAVFIVLGQIFTPVESEFKISKKITIVKDDGTVETWRKD